MKEKSRCRGGLQSRLQESITDKLLATPAWLLDVAWLRSLPELKLAQVETEKQLMA